MVETNPEPEPDVFSVVSDSTVNSNVVSMASVGFIVFKGVVVRGVVTASVGETERIVTRETVIGSVGEGVVSIEDVVNSVGETVIACVGDGVASIDDVAVSVGETERVVTPETVIGCVGDGVASIDDVPVSVGEN